MESQRRKELSGRIRIRWHDDAAGATPLELPARRMWPVGLIFGAMFAIFAGIAWMMAGRISGSSVRDVFDLMFVLFEGFWLLGWSVGVVILGALTVLLFFYGESARLQDGRLVHVPRLGPLKIIIEYDLARVRNVRSRTPAATTRSGSVSITTEGATDSATPCRAPTGRRLVGAIRRAAAAAGSVAPGDVAPRRRPASEAPRPKPPVPAPVPEAPESASFAHVAVRPCLDRRQSRAAGGRAVFRMGSRERDRPVLGRERGDRFLHGAQDGRRREVCGSASRCRSSSGTSAASWPATSCSSTSFFVRGARPTGPAPAVREALLGIFNPLWLSLAALFISHGVSFFDNFLGRREYVGATMKALMIAPYNRIIVMQLALIFGGWIILLLKSPVPVLALLVLLKTVLDFYGTPKEHTV